MLKIRKLLWYQFFDTRVFCNYFTKTVLVFLALCHIFLRLLPKNWWLFHLEIKRKTQ